MRTTLVVFAGNTVTFGTQPLHIHIEDIRPAAAVLGPLIKHQVGLIVCDEDHSAEEAMVAERAVQERAVRAWEGLDAAIGELDHE